MATNAREPRKVRRIIQRQLKRELKKLKRELKKLRRESQREHGCACDYHLWMSWRSLTGQSAPEAPIDPPPDCVKKNYHNPSDSKSS